MNGRQMSTEEIDAWEAKVNLEIEAFLAMREREEAKYVPAEDEQGT